MEIASQSGQNLFKAARADLLACACTRKQTLLLAQKNGSYVHVEVAKLHILRILNNIGMSNCCTFTSSECGYLFIHKHLVMFQRARIVSSWKSSYHVFHAVLWVNDVALLLL